jgi:hypothetical protein
VTFIVKPGRNKVLAAAWAGLEKQRKAEKKEKPEPTDVHTKPAKDVPKPGHVHRKAGKVVAKAAKKKGWRK